MASGRPADFDRFHLPSLAAMEVGDNPFIRKNAKVAVIGAGVSGVITTSRLTDMGVHVTMFEMGRGPGGRAATRREKVNCPGYEGQEVHFDHGVQFFTAHDARFKGICHQWERDGVIHRWNARVGKLDAADRTFQNEANGGETVGIAPKMSKKLGGSSGRLIRSWQEAEARYVGNPSSNSIVKVMTEKMKNRCVYSTRVTNMEKCSEGWHLKGIYRREKEKHLGTFTIIIWSAPSNGHQKWHRLYSMPPPVTFEKAPLIAPLLAGVDHEACFSVMLVFGRQLTELPFDVAFVNNSKSLCKVIRDSSKPLRQQTLPNPEWETWVLLSTPAYAADIMKTAPPGAAPKELLQSVGDTMVGAFRDATMALFEAAGSEELPGPIHQQAHRWGAAYPQTLMNKPALVDPDLCILACGDFCLSPDIEGACCSGLAAADSTIGLLKRDMILAGGRIIVENPIVEIDGDEMTKVMWDMVKSKLILPFLDLNLEYFDLGITARDACDDTVTTQAAEAINKCNVGVKCQTITPNAKWVAELGLKRMYPSPNTTIRKIVGGTIVREPYICDKIPKFIPGWADPVVICRHAVADHTEAAEMAVPGAGTVELVFTPADGGEPQRVALPQAFSGPGVALAQFNTDEAIRGFAHTCFKLAVARSLPLYLSTKDTILQVYDARFKDVFDELYAAEYKAAGVVYEHRLIDDMVAFAVKSKGGYVWACKNYDGDVQSDMIAQGYGSRALMTSLLYSADGKTMLSDASHGTVHRHFMVHSRGGEVSTNPMSTVLTWTKGLRHRAELDGHAALTEFCGKLEGEMLALVESGVVTKDLAVAIHGAGAARETYVTTGEFVDALAAKLTAAVGA